VRRFTPIDLLALWSTPQILYFSVGF